MNKRQLIILFFLKVETSNNLEIVERDIIQIEYTIIWKKRIKARKLDTSGKGGGMAIFELFPRV